MKQFIRMIVCMAVFAALSASAVTTTTNYTGTAYPVGALDKVYVLENTVTISSATAIGDIIKCIYIKAKSLVLAVGIEVVTADAGSAAIVELGDAGSSTQYVASTAVNATSFTGAAASTWEYYSAASDIRLTVGTDALTNAVIKVRAVIADLSR